MTPCYQRHELAPGIHADIPHEHEGATVKTMAELPPEVFESVKAALHQAEIAGPRAGASLDDLATAAIGALMAAGYGLVKAAAAGALREAAEAIEARRPEMGPGINITQYREGRNDAFALAADICNARAELIEAPNGP